MDRNKLIGQRVKTLREAKQLSQAELGERCALNEKQISEIEEGKEMPSLAPLIHISRALGVRLGTFLDDQENLGPVICRKNEGDAAISFSNGNDEARKHLRYYSLSSSKTGRHMEPFMISLAARSAVNSELSSHEGEEFIYVLQGKVEISYGNDIYTIEEGDSIYYDSIVPHLVRSALEQEARILAVIYTPF